MADAILETAPVEQIQTPPTAAPEPQGFDTSELENNAVGDDGITLANKPKPEAKPAEQKPAEKAPEKAVEKPDGKPVEAAKPGDAKPDKPKTAWQLVREREKELAELRTKHETVEREYTALKTKPQTPADDPEKKSLIEKLNKLEEAIQLKDFEKSDRYQKEYYEPWVKAHNSAIGEAMELMIETPDDATGEIKVRGVTQQEAYAVVTAQSKEEAIKIARKIFPADGDADKRNALVATRKEAYGALQKLWGAKEEFRTKGQEWEKAEKAKEQQTQAQRQAADQSRQTKWAELNELAIKNPALKDLFTAADDDAKGKELLTKGLKAADRAFGIGERDAQGNLLGDDGKPVDEDTMIASHSAVRNKAGAFNFVAYKLRAELSAHEATKKKLAEYEKSVPGTGAIATDKTKADSWDDIDSEIAKLAGR